MERQEIISRLAMLYGISEKDAKDIVGDGTDEEVSSRITQYITERIRAAAHFNREQRRAIKKKTKSEAELISNTSKKFAYIDLIQKLRELNEKKENENEGSC